MTFGLTDLLGPVDAGAMLRADARAGLTATPKSLPPRWFYDERGSELFDAITRLPEYYPTRSERSLLSASAGDISAASGADTVLDRELEADFDPGSFDHVAVWDPAAEWIEMRLRSTRAQVVHLAALDLEVAFAAGEELRTEVSAKFRRPGVTAELAAAGLRMTHWWTDPAGDFALSLSVPGRPGGGSAVDWSWTGRPPAPRT